VRSSCPARLRLQHPRRFARKRRVGFALLIGGVLAALWKLGILQNIETTWIVIGVVILAGLGIMVSIANSGTKQNIEIDRD
jgi:4-hydroxybenzoate polyprenyltransferase